MGASMFECVRVVKVGEARVDLTKAPVARRDREVFWSKAAALLEGAQGMDAPETRRKEYDSEGR